MSQIRNRSSSTVRASSKQIFSRMFSNFSKHVEGRKHQVAESRIECLMGNVAFGFWFLTVLLAQSNMGGATCAVAGPNEWRGTAR